MKHNDSISKKILNKLRTICKTARMFCFDVNYTLLNRIPKTVVRARGLRIAVYHGICDDQPHLFNSRYLSAKQFEDHLMLINAFYNPVSLSDVAHGNLSDEKLNILLTFDDGLKNNFSHAFPILKKHKVPAVFFVTGVAAEPIPYLFNDLADVIPFIAGPKVDLNGELFYNKKIYLHQRFVNKDETQLAHRYHRASAAERQAITAELIALVPEQILNQHQLYFELMNAAELKEISDHPDYDIGAHGYYHTDLSAISEKELQDELQQSVTYLSTILKKDVPAIAFPYGNYNQTVIDACEKEKFSYLFRTEKNNVVNTQVHLFERITVNPFVSAFHQMYYLAKNKYE
jgi:peptidoglycan/xylan/chitin deacetylase (PgdA/CDA1 family)